MSTKVFAVVVTYNPNVELFRKVISSISGQVPLILIDNASENLDEISSSFAFFNHLIFESLPSNIGLASAQNHAISIAKNKGASHVIFFDQDSIIEDGFVANLLDAESLLLKSGVKLGAVGSSFYDPSNNKLYPATLYWGPFIKRVLLDSEPVKATFIISSGCLIRISVLDDVGTMKDELFIDYIDVEWSLRASHFGYSVYVIPQARMAHTIGNKRVNVFGRPVSIHNPTRRYFMIRNSIFMMKLNYIPFDYKVREFVLGVGRFLIGLAFSNDRVLYTKFSIKGVLDGVKGKYGAL